MKISESDCGLEELRKYIEITRKKIEIRKLKKSGSKEKQI
jgi:hypothetical protein